MKHNKNSTPPHLAASQVEVQLPLTGGTWLAVPVVDDVDGEGVEGAVSGQGVGAGPGEGVDLVVEGAVVLLAPRHAHGSTTHGWVGCVTPMDKPTVIVQVCFPRIPVSLCVLLPGLYTQFPLSLLFAACVFFLDGILISVLPRFTSYCCFLFSILSRQDFTIQVF